MAATKAASWPGRTQPGLGGYVIRHRFADVMSVPAPWVAGVHRLVYTKDVNGGKCGAGIGYSCSAAAQCCSQVCDVKGYCSF